MRIEVDGLDFYTIDNSKGFRGFWVITSQARYWLRKPCSKVLEIPKMRIRVNGENVLVGDDDDEREACNKGELQAQLPSQEQLHQFHGAQLGLFCDILDLLHRSDGTYNTSIHNLSLTQVNKILASRQEAEMRSMTKSLEPSVRRSLGSKFLVPHLRVVDPNVQQSRWFRDLVASCDDNHNVNTGPNHSTVTESHRIEPMTTAEVKNKPDTLNKMERPCVTSSVVADESNRVDKSLPNRHLAPLEPIKEIVALFSRPREDGYPRPSTRKHGVIAADATSISSTGAPIKVSKGMDSSPKSHANIHSRGTGSVALPHSNPVTKGTAGAGTQRSSSSSPQPAGSRCALVEGGDDRRQGSQVPSNPSRSAPLLMRKPQKVPLSSNYPPSKNVQARPVPNPIESPTTRDKTTQAVAPVKTNAATDSAISFSPANTIIATIPKKPRTTGQVPQSKNCNPSRGHPSDQQNNTGTISTVPGNPCTLAEERQPKDVARAGSPMKSQGASNINPSPWKRQKISPTEFRQPVVHSLQAPSARGNGRQPGVPRYLGGQQPVRVDRRQYPSGQPIRGQTPMPQNQRTVHPGRIVHSLPQQRYKDPVRPTSSSQGDISQLPRRPDYNASHRFANRQCHHHHRQYNATQSQQGVRPVVRRHEDFPTGKKQSPSGVGNENNKTAQYLVGVGGKQPRDVLQPGENQAVNHGPVGHS